MNLSKRRLLKLADLLEADAKNKKGVKFSMPTWGYVRDESAPVSCGTQACAMGLAALSGAFKRAGLDYYLSDGHVQFTVNGVNMHGASAAEAIFEITHDDSMHLFEVWKGNGIGRAAEIAKAKQIRQFVKTGKFT